MRAEPWHHDLGQHDQLPEELQVQAWDVLLRRRRWLVCIILEEEINLG
jgi:hypothetical protein